jgi:hypothetical protein
VVEVINEYSIFEALRKAFGESTLSDNKFEDELNKISWEDQFEADGEQYFIIGGFVLTTPSINPFICDWRPSALFSDGSLIEL